MRFSRDESRALAFVALLIVLAAVARGRTRAPPVQWPDDAVDTDSLEHVARGRLEEGERRSRPLAPGERIDPNTAPEEELDRLPGIGAATARRIIAARDRDGPFRTLDDLTRVRGIGARTAARLAPHLRLPAARLSTPTVRRPDAATAVLADGARPTVAPDGGGGGRGGRAAAREAREAAPVDVNRATAAQLEALPGIGPALARRIIAYRDSVGPFRAVEELERVRGIGPATVERLRPRLRVKP